MLKQYAALFAPQIVGLRGTPHELAALARRYRVAYSTTPAENGHPYIDGTAQDLRTLIARYKPPDLLERMLRIV